jgi:hypothetical protein
MVLPEIDGVPITTLERNPAAPLAPRTIGCLPLIALLVTTKVMAGSWESLLWYRIISPLDYKQQWPETVVGKQISGLNEQRCPLGAVFP